MIEAANSVVMNYASLRGNAEQAAPARSYAANPEKIQEAAQAPYISPYVYVDVNFDRAVLQIRDSDTGDVVRQFPSESELETRRRAAAAQTRATVDIPDPEPLPSSSQRRDSGPRVSSGGSNVLEASPPTSQQIAAFEAGAQTAAGGQTGTVVATEA